MKQARYPINQELADKANFVSNIVTMASLAVADIADYPEDRQPILLGTVQYALEYLGDMASDVASHIHEHMAEQREGASNG